MNSDDDVRSSSLPSPSVSRPDSLVILLLFVERLNDEVHSKSFVTMLRELIVSSKPWFLISPTLDIIEVKPVIDGIDTA